jgi:tellurite resistance protein TerC
VFEPDPVYYTAAPGANLNQLATIQFFTGYLLETALAFDNIFVIGMIFTFFAVPREYQHRVLFWGILGVIVLRAIMISLGAALVNEFHAVLYFFGAFLVFTGLKMLKAGDAEIDPERNPLVRLARKLVRVSPTFDGDRFITRIDGKRAVTPLMLALVAIGFTDLLFALDSIPAIYGLTEEPYIVFTANAFALMGLRQLYFLIGGLLDRLIYLSAGLSIILGFIGVKLILHALHKNTLTFINNGSYVNVPEISTAMSISVITVVLLITTVASLLRTRGRAPTDVG